jgi:hypothetical protein
MKRIFNSTLNFVGSRDTPEKGDGVAKEDFY